MQTKNIPNLSRNSLSLDHLKKIPLSIIAAAAMPSFSVSVTLLPSCVCLLLPRPYGHPATPTPTQLSPPRTTPPSRPLEGTPEPHRWIPGLISLATNRPDLPVRARSLHVAMAIYPCRWWRRPRRSQPPLAHAHQPVPSGCTRSSTPSAPGRYLR